jgi:hypothetical protein
MVQTDTHGIERSLKIESNLASSDSRIVKGDPMFSLRFMENPCVSKGSLGSPVPQIVGPRLRDVGLNSGLTCLDPPITNRSLTGRSETMPLG